jgi:hypothetical protein
LRERDWRVAMQYPDGRCVTMFDLKNRHFESETANDMLIG